ncbi:VTT domain-containing protein [Streptomyces goshikiensis]|uniref:VTT domain-containing protein n=1 Tax=Streptomyces goshikiensis TaxID=1942 RepID=UPI0036B4C9E6
MAGALLGAQAGYLLGRRGGRTLLARSRSRKLHEGAAKAEEFLDRYGHAKAIVLARFVPIVRTVLNPMAGALNVQARIFTLWQVSGGLVWTVGLVMAGYALGSSVPKVDRYLLPIVALVVLISLAPLALEVIRRRGSRTSNGGSYLAKPFHLAELAARLRAAVKRTRPAAPVSGGEVVLDAVRHTCTVRGVPLTLTPTEFRILAALLAAAGDLVPRRDLVRAGWPEGAQVSDNTLDQYLTRLRRKLRESGSILTLGTSRGVGHRLS